MYPDPEMVSQLTAEETIALAIQSAGALDAAVVPDKNRPDFELVTLQTCFARIGAISVDPLQLASRITDCLRKYRSAGVSGIAAPAAEIAQILIDCVTIDDNSQSVLPLASIQIAASGLSLLAKNPDFERLMASCHALPYDAHIRRQIADIITALIPCSSAALSSQRWHRIAPEFNGFALLSYDELHDYLLFSDDHLASFKTDATWTPAHRLSFDSTEPENAARMLISSVMHSPVAWVYELYKNATEPRRHAIFMIMAGKLGGMQRVVPDEKDLGAWLRAESNNCRDIAAWLHHQKPDVAADDEDLRTLLTALRRRESDDPEWASFWLRNQHNTIRTFLKYHLATLSKYITIQAMRSIGASEQAHSTLEQFLANDGESPVIWLLMAECAIELDKYGIAVHAIERASESPQVSRMPLFSSDCAVESSFWKHAVLYVKHRLGRSALARAMRNPVVEPALLELALNYGDAQTVSEAALCWFDAALPDSDTAAQALVNSPEARECWILAISKRRDTSHLDRLYDFYLKIAQMAPDAPELAYLEALCQIDNPPVAVQTLGRVERKLKNITKILNDALSLHTELLAEMQAYDEAVNTVMPYLGTDNAFTRQILIGLMARMPREALPMLQTMMCEQLGRDKTLSIFENLRQPRQEPVAPPSPAEDNPWPALELSLLPVACQLIYRASRIGQKAVDTAKAARRESVLSARGMRTKTFDCPPQPAQWVHSPQHLASDAFND